MFRIYMSPMHHIICAYSGHVSTEWMWNLLSAEHSARIPWMESSDWERNRFLFLFTRANKFWSEWGSLFGISGDSVLASNMIWIWHVGWSLSDSSIITTITNVIKLTMWSREGKDIHESILDQHWWRSDFIFHYFSFAITRNWLILSTSSIFKQPEYP